MRILIVSAFFPPCNAIGALRVGKFAKFLVSRGHDVRVVAAAEDGLPKTVDLELAPEHVRFVPWNRALVNLPDSHIGWHLPAVAAGEATIRDWRPDLIYASAAPQTALLVAHRLSRRHNIPWVAELGDLRGANHDSTWRRAIGGVFERHVLSSASLLVTVSEPLAEVLRAKYGKPTIVVMNDYEPGDEQFDILDLHLAQAATTAVGPRRKVLVVTRKLDVGGTERHLLQVLPHLDRARFAPEIMVLRPGGRLESRMLAAGVPVTAPPPGLDGWPALIWSAVRLTLTLLRHRRGIVHFFLPEAYAVGGLCGLLAHHPRMIMSRRSLNAYQAGHPWVARLERFLHRRMHIVVGNSRAVLADLRAEGVNEDRLGLIYNGIDSTPFTVPRDRAAIRRRLGLEADELMVVMVANLIPYKGHMDLVEALATVAPQLPPWRVLMAGRDDGIGSKIQQRSAELGLGRQVSLLGECDEVADLLAAADIGVLCSHQEGFANSVLEGMAAGLPMVVTDVGGNAEAVIDGQTGRVVPAHDPATLGAAILELARNPLQRAALGAAAKRRVEDVFSLEACVKGYDRLYAAASVASFRAAH